VRLFGYLAPWIIFLPAFIWRDKKRVPAEAEPGLERFCWCWFLTVLIFFSISKAKANYYIIAGMPPLIMLFVFRMREAKEFIYSKLIFIILNIAFCLVPLVFILVWFSPLILEHLAASYVWAAKLHQQVLPLQTYFAHFKIPAIITAVFALAGLFVVWYARRRENIREYYIWTIAAFASLVCVLIISQVYLRTNTQPKI
jgi:4-amino-4-deoxy-L-arabinose transferase-like glycosyltransferase